MDVRAMVLVGAPAANNTGTDTGLYGGVPIATLDVLGRSVVDHVVARLKAAGIEEVVAIVDQDTKLHYSRNAICSEARWIEAAHSEYWTVARQTFERWAEAGMDEAIVLHLGPYAEINYDDLLHSHLAQRRSRVTAVIHNGGSAGTFVLGATKLAEATALFSSGLQSPGGCAEYRFEGYFNPLQNADDLRQLTIDSFMQETSIQPKGLEIRPGVWVGEGARVHKTARLLAPCFVGPRARVHASAIVTRGATVGRHSEVDCGTVVDAANVLPFTYLGAGLDVTHCVAGLNRISNLRRSATVEVTDRKLMHNISQRAPVRIFSAAAGLASFWPKRLLDGNEASKRAPLEHVQPGRPVLQREADTYPRKAERREEISPNLLVTRQYGNE